MLLVTQLIRAMPNDLQLAIGLETMVELGAPPDLAPTVEKFPPPVPSIMCRTISLTVLGLALSAGMSRAADTCAWGAASSACGAPAYCHHCGLHRRHCCCALVPPQGVVLPSAPALFFGASTLSVVPAGFNTQAFGAAPPVAPNEAELLRLLKLLQSQPLGAGAGTCSSGGAPLGVAAPGAPAPLPAGGGLTVEARLAQVEADVRQLQAHVQEHTRALAEIIRKDPELLKKFQVVP
jgi:hypothetical protein